MFLNKQQISCLAYKLANWKMVFQNHGKHMVGFYIHHMNVWHFALVDCKEEDVSAQKEVGERTYKYTKPLFCALAVFLKK